MQTRIRSLEEAAAFVRRVGFCFLFPQRGLRLGSLWSAVKRVPAFEEWDEEAERLWGWKDDLPLHRRAFYGKLLRRKPTFVAPEALTLFLGAGSGRPADARWLYREGKLSPEARDVALWVEEQGPTPTATLRRRLGRGGRARIDRALEQLQVALVLTHFGRADLGSGWPSGVVELTERVFPEAVAEARIRDPEAARAELMALYRRQQPEADSRDAARLFGWPAGQVERAW